MWLALKNINERYSKVEPIKNCILPNSLKNIFKGNDVFINRLNNYKGLLI